MGCNTSKLDNLPAVALCRDRCKFLDDALQHSYDLADAHVAYMQSLKTIGPLLHRFFEHDGSFHCPDDPSNGDPAVKSSKSSPPDHSPSSLTSDSHIQFDSDSHIQFDSDSEEEDRNKDFETFNRNQHNYFNQEILGSISDTFMPVNYNDSSRSYRYNNYSTYNVEFSDGDWAHKTPPPPTPSSSAWDFLNFFEPLEKYEPPHSPNRESKQVNESDRNRDKISAEKDQVKVKPTLLKEKGDEGKRKKVISEKEQPSDPESKNQSGQRGVSEVMKEVEILFERASESGSEVLKMFDAGKCRYHQKYSISQVSSKMFYAVSPLKVAVSAPLSNQGFDNDVVLNPTKLTATLKKLCLWERKLYDEVKAEEKLRILYARKCKQMKSLDDKDAETLKVEAARTMLRTLSTKLKIAIHVIDKMSIAINKLRDEELWPQVNELVQRLLHMWNAMLECHRGQFQTVMEAKSLDGNPPNRKLENAHLEVAIKLKSELQNWNLNFSNWIEAQKGYVKALNGWLLKCIRYEPEETPDGIAPFSPGRIGAPPVFVIAYQWSQAMGMLSEKEVAEALQGLFTSVSQLLEQHNTELQQMAIANKDMDRKVKILEREEGKMQGVLQAREKKMTLLDRETNNITNTGSLQAGLKQTFRAIERFAANSKQAYDVLRVRIEEGKFTERNSAGS